jgi:MFS transporter, DHA2 family, multidrug resistance protein
MAASALYLGRRRDIRIGLRAIFCSGLLVLSAGTLIAVPSYTTSAAVALVVATVVAGMGAISVQSFETSTLLGAAPPEFSGSMSSARGVVDYFGVAVGLGLMPIVLAAGAGRALGGVIRATEGDPVEGPTLVHRTLQRLGTGQSGAARRAGVEVVDHHLAHAVDLALFVTAGVVVLGAIVVFVLTGIARRSDAGEARSEVPESLVGFAQVRPSS